MSKNLKQLITIGLQMVAFFSTVDTRQGTISQLVDLEMGLLCEQLSQGYWDVGVQSVATWSDEEQLALVFPVWRLPVLMTDPRYSVGSVVDLEWHTVKQKLSSQVEVVFIVLLGDVVVTVMVVDSGCSESLFHVLPERILHATSGCRVSHVMRFCKFGCDGPSWKMVMLPWISVGLVQSSLALLFLHMSAYSPLEFSSGISKEVWYESQDPGGTVFTLSSVGRRCEQRKC